jgi:hypothetical protein
MPNTLKEILLGRGWAGKTITRAETVEHLNPLIEQQVRINHSYEYVIREHGNPSVVSVLERLQKTARGDVGKLSETVLSCGGTPYNGTDLEADDFDLGSDDREMLHRLQDLDEEFRDALAEERTEVDHQMRTRAILEVVKSNTEERLSTLRELTNSR